MITVLVACVAVAVVFAYGAVKSRMLYRTYGTISAKNGAVLITGVSSGIGRSMALYFVSQGWTVLGTVRKERDAKAIAELGIKPIILDVAKEATVVDGVKQIEAVLSRNSLKLAALVNNAGVNPEADMMKAEKKGEDTEAVAWPAGGDAAKFTFDVNVIGVLSMVKHLLPILQRDKGRIVNIGSYFGSFTPLGLRQISYSASKHAVEVGAPLQPARLDGTVLTACVCRVLCICHTVRPSRTVSGVASLRKKSRWLSSSPVTSRRK